MAPSIVVLCQSTSSTLASFEDFVVAMHEMVQRMARDCQMPIATVKTLTLPYSSVCIAPFPSCIRAAALWSLDCSKPIFISQNLYVKDIANLTYSECVTTAYNEGLSIEPEPDAINYSEEQLLFVPAEYEGHFRASPQYNLFEVEEGVSRSELGVILARVQGEVKAAIEVLANEVQ